MAVADVPLKPPSFYMHCACETCKKITWSFIHTFVATLFNFCCRQSGPKNMTICLQTWKQLPPILGLVIFLVLLFRVPQFFTLMLILLWLLEFFCSPSARLSAPPLPISDSLLTQQLSIGLEAGFAQLAYPSN